jgi:hypothetical protein
MVITEITTENGFKYQTNVFGTITLHSTDRLDAQKVDTLVLAVLNSGAREGEIAGIKFTFESESKWQDD